MKTSLRRIATRCKARELGVRRFVAEMWYTGSVDWKSDVKAANAMLCGVLGGR
ncbi:MAG: hypothetical protein ACTTKL_00670 [Treponema sp.]